VVQGAAPLPGRWELAAGLAERTIEQRLNRAFERAIVLCRDTARDLPWDQALAVLRVWELTGRARRGYFIEGLSGAQFIREDDYEATIRLLAQPRNDIVWLSAADPAQQWGKCLPHRPGLSFMNVPGTAVALCAGTPVAVFARFGQSLRIFEFDGQGGQPPQPQPQPQPQPEDILRAFARQFRQRRIYIGRKNITVRRYSPAAEHALEVAGFSRNVRDYVLYRD
jgi:ATP-dependent Lhr-like helicase